ncbi:MAG: hypothetical protein IKH47_02410, partial [Bacteroidaceae bacterium]|nr:hypothetical protein [Bacteroidaceae bacterium]
MSKLVQLYSAALNGLQAIPVEVEVHSTKGIKTALVGLPDNAVKESLDRMERDLLRAVKSICQFRRIDCRQEKINDVSPIRMSPETEEGLVKAARELG